MYSINGALRRRRLTPSDGAGADGAIVPESVLWRSPSISDIGEMAESPQQPPHTTCRIANNLCCWSQNGADRGEYRQAAGAGAGPSFLWRLSYRPCTQWLDSSKVRSRLLDTIVLAPALIVCDGGFQSLLRRLDLRILALALLARLTFHTARVFLFRLGKFGHARQFRIFVLALLARLTCRAARVFCLSLGICRERGLPLLISRSKLLPYAVTGPNYLGNSCGAQQH